ncbi:aldehyde dehydrogenase family 3 member F1 [Manihot esculenta]|uniref:Aldehyde dehydrogenase n=1 Tax=Manihot esculenta TaxID=3983 RepID=A0A2C9VSX5_MANES|nr:aldehyde dehydrogenase family 3 member F1 [Manihot esculenta]OAY48534.1 hypothetical protein MANES_06G165200v8 [Manihot esculenta]
MESELERMREYFKTGNTKCASWRLSQLKGLLLFIKEREADIFQALKKDLGKHPVEAFRDEVGLLIKSINFALKGLKTWMSSKKVNVPKIAFLTTAELVPQPLGLVLIISSWNFPLGLSLEPLIGAIAAGNTVVLKPSELAPACASLLVNLLPTYLDTRAIKVVQGGSSVGEQLLQKKWDKIFFTGSARVGRIVMSAAVKNLTPVVLELGGKCPAVVDSLSSSWDKQATANRIAVAKFGSCAGQACLAIDYVLVEKKFASTLVELMKDSIKNMFGDNPRESNTMARIINKHHFSRFKNILSDLAVQKSIVYGGSMDEENLFIKPTILLDPPLQSEIMTDEIFGPLLPIITLDKIEDSIEFINSKPKPLAVYAFTKNKQLKRRLEAETSSGSLVFNDALVQYVLDTVPFGGIGESGIGKYHGKFSFDTFTHHKAVTRRSFLIDAWFRFPPWNGHKFMLFETCYTYDYLGILLVLLGLKRCKRNLDGI